MRDVFDRRTDWRSGRGSYTDDYLAFRQTALDLAGALDLDMWGMERLCLWLDRHVPVPVSLRPARDVVAPAIAPAVSEGTEHTHVQWLLAQLGKQLGVKVWIAPNDHSTEWNGVRLGTSSVAALPTFGIGDAAQRIVRLIDVIWFKGANQIVAAFEIESTTSIYSGLLRMSDLTVLAPNSNFPIFVVAPTARLDKVRAQLRRPTFQTLGLHDRCRFFSIEHLIENAPAMLKWMNDPSGIDKIAERVGDVDEEVGPAATVDGEVDPP